MSVNFPHAIFIFHVLPAQFLYLVGIIYKLNWHKWKTPLAAEFFSHYETE